MNAIKQERKIIEVEGMPQGVVMSDNKNIYIGTGICHYDKAELMYILLSKEREKQRECLFLDDVVEREVFDEVMKSAELDLKTDSDITDAAVGWADAASKEAFVSGYITAMKVMGGERI